MAATLEAEIFGSLSQTECKQLNVLLNQIIASEGRENSNT